MNLSYATITAGNEWLLCVEAAMCCYARLLCVAMWGCYVLLCEAVMCCYVRLLLSRYPSRNIFIIITHAQGQWVQFDMNHKNFATANRHEMVHGKPCGLGLVSSHSHILNLTTGLEECEYLLSCQLKCE